MQATLGINNDDRERAGYLIEHLDDKQTLKLLREETTLLVLMVRIANQKRREQFDQAKADNLPWFENGE
ncbi:MAG: hypothetical protein DRJ03_01425 [Chloroflexi bacterium]|nr:MAG: hypothetical protein DRJ03_01425 [Chloroflexota bacterium]